MRPLLHRLLLTQKPAVKTSRNSSPTGFTLIELLIAVLMGALVLIPLLGLVINVLDTDRKEQAKSMSEQELKDAADFITEDLKQAVYIYDNDGINRNSSLIAADSGIKNQIPPTVTGVCPAGVTCTPILVFWKREYFPDSMPIGNKPVADCIASATNKGANCDDAYTYSLVGYYLLTGPTNSPTWSQQARIARFVLNGGIGKMQTTGATAGTMAYSYPPDPGYAPFDMSKSGDLKVKMNQWKKHSTQAFGANSMRVLVDYIDKTANTPAPLACVSNTDPTQAEQRVPATGSNNFYACVNSYKNSARFFIRGNALERINANSSYAPNRIAYFPTVTVQVQGRGFLFAQ